ncbi:C2H2-type zinc finger protein [Halopiger goleimassiliensis]|uniref:C2H2-type zinc finger protein n=1 Tax=Halopiger goleimassiliensis TaxID=1293048 RepID=UPI0012B63464|nr:C2H2-type zinc finger protein [Halopiger goleimassiliensis]
MTDPQCCPLCPETFADRTDLQVHLEVSHRKSEVVSALVDAAAEGTDEVDERSTTDAARPDESSVAGDDTVEHASSTGSGRQSSV